MTQIASIALPRLAVRGLTRSEGLRQAPEEVAVALVYGGTTQAVLMATPADLRDLAVGFSLTEGIIDSPQSIAELEVVHQRDGVELRMWLAEGASKAFIDRRRSSLGPTGCGLCGIESLAEAVRPVRRVESDLVVSAAEIMHAVGALSGLPLGSATRAVHAAGLWRPDEGLRVVREDVGRHNALDKVAGALARRGEAAHEAIVVLTSRVSVEMVQKTARMGASIIAAISAPTALAVRTAEQAGITLAAVARDDGFEIFTAPGRIGLKGS
jgi:FdhD protein